MARFGWAYINCEDSGSQALGVPESVQYMTQAGNRTSGSANLLFRTGATEQAHHTLVLTGTLIVSGSITASHYHIKDVSTIDSTGSTYFGNSGDDVHIRTGSLRISGASGVRPTLFTKYSNVSYTDTFGYMVGIGTDSPGHTLEISGTVSASSNISASRYYGSGEFLASIPIDGGVNNRIITAKGPISIKGESGLQYESTMGSALLTISGAIRYTRDQVASAWTITKDQYYIGVDSSGGTRALTLPAASTLSSGQSFIIKDEGGAAATNSITVVCAGSDTIDGENTVVLDSSYASITIFTNGSNKYFII